jgi:hypothetical protein
MTQPAFVGGLAAALCALIGLGCAAAWAGGPPDRAARVQILVPRLSGTVLGPFGRQAVFAIGGGQSSLAEGDDIAGWTVREIGDGTATLLRSDAPGPLRLTVAGGDPEPVASLLPSAGRFTWNNPCGRRHKGNPAGRSAEASVCRSVLALLPAAAAVE